MKFYKIAYESLIFPIKSYNYLLILGILLITSLIAAFIHALLTQNNGIISLVSLAVFLFFGVIFIGFFIRVVHSTIHNEKIKNFNLFFNIYEGIKFLFLIIFYFMIPTLILTLLIIISGQVNAALTIGDTIANLITQIITDINFLPDLLLYFLFAPITQASGLLILDLIFSAFLFVGIGRYADEFNLIRGVDLGTIINIISEVWLDYILWIVVTLAIVFILLFLSYFLLFSIIGILFYIIIVQPFILLFLSRSIGLMYKEICLN